MGVNMPNYLRFFILQLVLFILFSCTPQEKKTIRLTSSLPSGTLMRNSVFQFHFSRGVVLPESTNIWLNVPYVEFDPPIEGKFVWQDTNKLVFSPDGLLPGDMKFKGRLNKDLIVQLSHATEFKGKDEFEFSTESFMLKSAEFFYDRIDNKRTVGIKANLIFTYAVKPEDISKYIDIQIDGEKVKDYKVVTSVAHNVIPIEIGTFVQFNKEREIRVNFDKNLTSPETNTKISFDKPLIYKIPPLEDLRIYGHEFGFDGTESWIRIKTSQEVDMNNIKQYIVMEPSLKYTIEPEPNLSFRIKGKFEPGTKIHLMVKKGLESILGAKTQNDYETDIVIANIKPSYGFSSSGSYMLLSGLRSVEIKTVNINKLNVRISQIFQNNLVHFLDGGRSYDYYDDYYYEDEEEGYYRRKYRYYVGNYGRIIATDTIKIKSVTNQEVTTLFDLSPYLQSDYKGIYLVEISSPEESWKWTSKLVALSDIGIIVKESESEFTVFTVSLDNNNPLSGVQVSLISTNNQIIASKKTDGDGVAKFADYQDLKKKFRVKLVMSELNNDFNFISLSDYRVETSRFNVSGKRESYGLYDAFMYGDRNLYRPGEKIHVTGIVRVLSGHLLEDMPVKIRVYDPRSNKLTEMQRKLNDQGSFEVSYQTLETASTGEYEFHLYTGDDVFLTSYAVSVEDFVPDRLRVILKTSKDTIKVGEKIQYEITALNFFGPPAVGRSVEFEAMMEHKPFRSIRFPDFRFSWDNVPHYSSEPHVEKATTDREGKCNIIFSVPANIVSSGLLNLKGTVSVFDETGRPVHQIAQTTVAPSNYFIGVKSYIDYYVSPHSPLKIQIVAVDIGDKPVDKLKVRVDIVRKEWYTVLRMDSRSNSFRYVSEQREVPVQSQNLTLSGNPTDFTFTVPRSGDYVVRVVDANSNNYNQIGFYAYSWGATTDLTSFEVNPEARVNIVLDKKVYEPGDKAKVLFQTPFSGKMLVTIERNKVFSYKYIDVEKNSASMIIDVEDSFLPNAYISAVLFRKIKELNIPLMCGHGFEPIMVEKKSNRLNIAIEAPDKIRPKTKQRFTVRIPNETDVYLTLAAVDEGICQIKGYKTPDPYSYFYAKKALEVETYDFFRDLIPEPIKKSSPGGGEFEEKRPQYLNPLSVKRFKPIALWSGIIKTNSGGVANVDFDIPDFNGELRLMAVAYKNDAFGSAQKAMKVADPVVISPALPRFLSPGDIITMPVTVFNTTNNRVFMKLEVVTEGSIKTLQHSAQVEVRANGENFATFTLKATEEIGKAVVKVRTEVLGEKLESVTELPVRPISPYVTEATSGFVEAGKEISFDIPDIFYPFNRKGYVVLSPFPVANFAKQLKHLVGYPHGCIEQTTSRAFPQIYLRDIALILDPSILDKGSPSYFVNEAIKKITGMQLHDGSFSYWPGGGYSSDWSTVYATHFLIEAKKAGYEVPENVLSSALNFVKSIARKRNLVDYYYYENNMTRITRVADKSAIYALYVLALAGQPEKTLMNFYRTSKHLLTNDTKYLLAGAFGLCRDRSAYLEIMPNTFVSEEAKRTSGGCFDSPIRATAIMLNVLLETDPNNPNIARYMEYLSSQFNKYYWFSTQEEAFALVGFGKAARSAKAGKIKGTVTIGDKRINYDGSNKRIPIEKFDGKIKISMQGEGKVFYSIILEGIRKDGKIRIEDKNLSVRRQFFDRFGNPISMEGIKQNSLVIVRIIVKCDIDNLDNVAITDLLPAGFEIENPRLTESSQYAFTKDASTPAYVDIRDDRINYYINFYHSHEQKFYYLVRAVTKGEFNYAPIVSEAMYDGDYYSASGGGKVTVIE